MSEKKLSPLSSKWYPIELNLLEKCYRENKNYKKITAEINKLRASFSNGKYLNRSVGAITYRLREIGLISAEEHQRSYIEWKRRKDSDRKEGLRKMRKNVLERDDEQCVICKSKENLEISHIIPFNQTRKNNEKECVTLCFKHHQLFDRHHEKTIKKVYKHMCGKYSDYSIKFEFLISYCNPYPDLPSQIIHKQ